MKRLKTDDDDIYQLENGTYYYRGKPPGSLERIERSLFTTDYVKAQIAKGRLLMEIEKDGIGIFRKAGPLMNKYLDEERRRHDIGDIRESTLTNTEWAFANYLIPFYEKKEIGQIDAKSFDRLRQHFGPHDYQNQRKHLKSFLLWCRAERLLTHVPEFDVGKHKKRRRAILTNDEIVEVVKHSRGNLLLFVAMYLFQGMRSAEITKLRWSYVDLNRRMITLPDSATKGDEERQFPINNFVWIILQRRALEATCDWVFPNAKGELGKTPFMSVGGFNKPFKNMLKRTAVNRHITPHDLRATYEKFAHVNPNFTDTQREKMVGASVEVQRRVYLNSFTADDLRGLEQVVDFKELGPALELKIVNGGKLGGAEISDTSLASKRLKAKVKS